MDGELPPVVDERKLDACLRKLKTGMVYRHGVIQFKTRRYRGEFLRAFAGQKVTLRYDSSNILRLFTYELETDGKPGRFLGYAEMQAVDEINYWIRKLQLPLRELDLNNLESETLTLEALEYVLSEAEARGKELDNTTKPTRVKYQGKRQDLVVQREREASGRNRRSRSKGKESSKPTTQVNNSSIDALPASEVTESIAKLDSKSDRSLVAFKDDAAHAPSMIKVPEPQKIISIQAKRHEKNIESFKEQLQAAETNHPKLVVSRRKGRSR
nr:Mu transposase C-terminal domain-containing protein [Phormidium sp. FACHB-592]